jgi:endonuclease/exonuclease/phosphatase family metal-dependent hydrolase
VSLRIATFNVLFARGEEGPGAWPRRVPIIRRAIARARPDAIGFQEVFPSMLEAMRGAAGDLDLMPGPTSGPPRWFDVSPAGELVLRIIRSRRLRPSADVSLLRAERQRTGEHLPIAYRTDRLRPLASGAFWISATPDRPGSMLALAPVPFMVHWVRFARAEGGRPLLMLNAHFGHAPWHYGPTARVVSERIGALTADHPDIDVALVGDFNTWPSSPLLMALERSGLRDGVRAAPEQIGPPRTFHWGTGARRFGVRLDHVLVRGTLRPVRAEVIEEREGEVYGSDHHPLVVEVETV